jgi:abortive infection bacteriophage resistance protein
VYQNYIFDRKLRNLISYLIEGIEVALKTLIAYKHSLNFGSLGYLDANNYNDKYDEKVFKDNMAKYIGRNSKHPVILHHEANYGGKYPFWVIIEFYNFGDLSKLFSQLPTSIQKNIAKDLNLNYSIVSSWLYCLTHLRNSCAHYSRLYNTKMISIPKTPLGYSIKLDKSIFSYMLVLKELTVNSSDWHDFREKLKLLISKFGASIDISRLGFPSNWETHI